MAIDINQLTEVHPAYNAQWGIEGSLFGCQGNDLEHSRKADKIDGSGFGTRFRNSLPGLRDGSLKIKGLAAMERGALQDKLNGWSARTSPVNAWFALQGLNALAPITMQPSSVLDNTISAKLKDAVDFSAELDARGAVDDGIILLSPGTVLTGASGMGQSDNNTIYGGATSWGGAAYLFVWAYDGGTSPAVTVTIQHSPDGVTWTNLVVFAAQSAASASQSQRIPIPSTTTINAYTQAIYTISGSPTDVQVLCGLARTPNYTL